MLNEYRLDLHIHTCLSPCGDSRMIPPGIVDAAIERGLDGIMIADHNSAENVMAVKEEGARRGFPVLEGMEVCSQEEIHVLCMMEGGAIMDFQEMVYSHLPGENSADTFGEQWIVNPDGTIAGRNNRLLIGATTMSIEELIAEIRDRNGIAIASHVDRQAFSLVSQLGFVPPHLGLDAVEVSPNYRVRPEIEDIRRDFAFVTFSDAHFPEEIGRAHTGFVMETMTLDEVRKALHGMDGRRVTA
ncbi:MAG: PHP domain-containing protein [Spirochaetales bacterium]|nr:PHP domain-containing protein [Spirochaetales bacterium]